MVDADWGGHSGSRLGLDIGGTLAKLVFFMFSYELDILSDLAPVKILT